MDELSDHIIKGYHLQACIGSGNFGPVYRARQTAIGREVAVKIILPRFANRPEFIRRFETEARFIARLEHLHIVPLYDYWRDPSGAYLVMRWLRGGSLAQALAQGPFGLAAAALLIDQIAAALTVAHRQGVIHRDLKPANILLDEEGNAYLSDFGIARDLAQARVAEEGLVGSPDYLSPEQAQGAALTTASDIYSLGVTLYELLAGHHPFMAKSASEQVYKCLHDPLPLLDDLADSVAAAVNSVIQKATAKQPDQRYGDALALAKAFRRAAGLAEAAPARQASEQLTRREQQILQLIIAGNTNREIAQTLIIEVSTVKWYITQIYRKIGVRSRMQAIIRGRELNLVVPIEGDTAEVEAGNSATGIALPEPKNPYKGLHAFSTVDSGDFFGREALTQRLIERLSQAGQRGRFLALVGPSGSGKSSLLKAGLIPALWRGDVPGSERWFIVDMTPSVHPLDELEVALIRLAATQTSNLRQQLDRDANGLQRVAGLILPEAEAELVLVVDQFEEAFTLTADEAERRHFIDLLCTVAAAQNGRVRVVIALRADHYHQPLQYPDLAELMREGLEPVVPLKVNELEQAILGPARRAGVELEPGLLATMIEAIHHQPGALPLLQYMLTELFEHRQGRTLTLQSYEALDGMAGVLSGRAEALYQELNAAGRDLVRQLFLNLVVIGQDYDDLADRPTARPRVSWADLLALGEDPEQMDDIIDAYAAYRLLTLDHDPATRRPTVAIAHEAVLQAWPRLRTWLDESRQDLYQQRRLQVLLGEWLAGGRQEGLLLREMRLDQFAAWAEQTTLTLTTEEQAFLRASLAARQQRRAAETARRVRELAAQQRIEVLSQQAKTALGLSFWQKARARQEAQLAKARELAAAAVYHSRIDPQAGMWLALAAVEEVQTAGLTVPREIEQALHLTVQASPLERVLPHGGAVVSAVDFSPDGAQVLTADSDPALCLWDAYAGEKVLAIAHPPAVKGVGHAQFSPDGLYLATGGSDGVVYLWHRRTGKAARRLVGHTQAVNRLVFSGDGRRLASGGQDGRALVWDVASGRQLTEICQDLPLVGVALSPDGHYLAATTTTTPVQLWNIDTGVRMAMLDNKAAQANWATQIAYSPDGARLAAASIAGSVTIWDAKSGAKLLTFYGHHAPTQALAFSCDGRCIASASDDHQIQIWDAQTGEVLNTLVDHHIANVTLAFSPDGTRLIVGDSDGKARIWNLADEREWLTIQRSDSSGRVAFSPDGQYLLVGAGGQGAAQVWETAGGRLRLTLAADDDPATVTGVDYSPDSRLLATASLDGTVRLWDSTSGQLIRRVHGHDGPIYDVAFEPNGRWLASAGADRTVRYWRVGDGSLQHLVADLDSEVVALALYNCPDEVCSALVTKQGRGYVVSPDGSVVHLGGYDERLLAIAASADGAYLAAGGVDTTAIIWSTEALERCQRLQGHVSAVTGMAFAPDSRCLATASPDGTVRIWDVQSGRERLVLATKARQGSVHVAFSPDGRLLTTSGERHIRLFVAALKDLVQLAQDRLRHAPKPPAYRRYLDPEPADEPVHDLASQSTRSRDQRSFCLMRFYETQDPYSLSFLRGAELVGRELGWLVDTPVAMDPSAYIQLLTSALEAGYDLIALFDWPVDAVVADLVATRSAPRFIIVDESARLSGEVVPNIWRYFYAADQASFLAGYLAASVSQTGVVGTFGGVAIATVVDFMTGFELGVGHYNQSKGANVQLLGWNANRADGLFVGSWWDEVKGRELADQLLDGGADIIFPVTGAAGVGAAKLIQERSGALLIGVDVDWAEAEPAFAPFTLTSVEKRIERTFLAAARAVEAGTFRGCVRLGTLETGEVGLAPFHQLADRIPQQLHDELAIIEAAIVRGEIRTRL